MFYPEKFAYNIKFHRKRLGLTQKELAERLYLSPQNVSKWEKGICTPDIENLCRLSDVLGCSVDSLVGNCREEGTERYYLAIDGGGTKTELLLFCDDGTARARTVLSASNPNSVSPEGTFAVLNDGLKWALSHNVTIDGVYAGIAGCGNAENRRAVLRLLRKSYPDLRFEIFSDIMNVYASCEGNGDNKIAVICGTGSVVYAMKERQLYQCGGWGYLFDGAGSGFDLGRDAVRVALASVDGLCERGLVTEYVEEALGTNAKKAINELYSKGRDYIASFSSAVFRAAREGDGTALEILEANTDRIAALIDFTVNKYSCREGVILSGGLTTERELFCDRIIGKLKSKITVTYSEYPQILGSARLCYELFSENSDGGEWLLSRLLSGYEMLKKEK